MKFEDRSHEESERQQRCARSKAWNLAKNKYKLKEKDKTTFYSPAEEWVLPAASTKEPEERKFVVYSGASMHMVSNRDRDSAELETIRTSRSPTTVMTANGEVQTREEATVYVKELYLPAASANCLWIVFLPVGILIEMISSPVQETVFAVITLTRESNCTCREKRHSQFHWN